MKFPVMRSHPRERDTFPVRAIDAPCARAGGAEIEEKEAEQNRCIAAIISGEDVPRGMGHEVTDRHLAGEDERDRACEKSDQQQRSADEFKDASQSKK